MLAAGLDRLGQFSGPLRRHAQPRAALRVLGDGGADVAPGGRHPHAGRHVAPLAVRVVEAA